MAEAEPEAGAGAGAEKPAEENLNTSAAAPSAPAAAEAQGGAQGEAQGGEKGEAQGEAPITDLDLFSEQFANYLRIAKAIITTFKRPRDVQIATDILRQLEQHNDKRDVEIRRNNNLFFRYFLRILKTTSQKQPINFYNAWYKEKDTPVEALSETRTWLEENKSYISMKSLSDGSSILYAAVAYNPKAGWQDGGLKLLEQRGAQCKSTYPS